MPHKEKAIEGISPPIEWLKKKLADGVPKVTAESANNVEYVTNDDDLQTRLDNANGATVVLVEDHAISSTITVENATLHCENGAAIKPQSDLSAAVELRPHVGTEVRTLRIDGSDTSFTGAYVYLDGTAGSNGGFRGTEAEENPLIEELEIRGSVEPGGTGLVGQAIQFDMDGSGGSAGVALVAFGTIRASFVDVVFDCQFSGSNNTFINGNDFGHVVVSDSGNLFKATVSSGTTHVFDGNEITFIYQGGHAEVPNPIIDMTAMPSGGVDRNTFYGHSWDHGTEALFGLEGNQRNTFIGHSANLGDSAIGGPVWDLGQDIVDGYFSSQDYKQLLLRRPADNVEKFIGLNNANGDVIIRNAADTATDVMFKDGHKSIKLNEQDVRAISTPAAFELAVHDGSGTNTAGLAMFDGVDWISQVDGSTIA